MDGGLVVHPCTHCSTYCTYALEAWKMGLTGVDENILIFIFTFLHASSTHGHIARLMNIHVRRSVPLLICIGSL